MAKAKELFHTLIECKDQETFESKFEQILKDLVEEAQTIIKKRGCKTVEAKRSAIMEIDGKWKALVNLTHTKKHTIPEDSYMLQVNLMEDGFKAAYVHIHPDDSWFFDLNAHSNKMDKMREEQKKSEEEYKKAMEFSPYPVTTLRDINMNNIHTEILNIFMALGNYYSIGFSMDMIRPLAIRCHFLKWCVKMGKITEDMINDYEADTEAWFEKHRLEV